MIGNQLLKLLKNNRNKTRDKMNLEDKINIVKEILKDKKVAIGFSGGADSTLMAYLSSKVAKETLAITINNHLFPSDFIENTKNLTERFGIKHEIIDINFFNEEEFLKNDSSRCYNCRNLMYSHIEKIANEKGFDFICDGNNISDLVIDRPGILITYKKGFETPFIDAKLTSKDIHRYLDLKNIPYSKSTTCLATRIPTNTKTTPEKIKRINHCENYILKNTKCQIAKVRDLEKYAIIEVDNLEDLFNSKKYDQINAELIKQGFKSVAVNLSQIDDDEFIKINYTNNSFSYQLPFTINIVKTKKQLNRIISCTNEKINLEKITVHENGLIEGYDLETYETALDAFMDILPKLRRNI